MLVKDGCKMRTDREIAGVTIDGAMWVVIAAISRPADKCGARKFAVH
jgi:hypothetical protein